MAKLKNRVVTKLKEILLINQEYDVNDFIAEHEEGSILSCRYVENGKLILVQEWIKKAKPNPLLFWTFFNALTLEKVDPNERYLNENDKQWQEQLDENKVLISKVVVHKENGCEEVIEQVFEDNVLLSNKKYLRYEKRKMSKLEELASIKESLQQKIERKDAFISAFLTGGADKKFVLLNTAFNYAVRSHSEYGFEPVEAFLHRPIYNEIKDDPLFEVTLKKVLEYNSKWLNKDASTLYNIVITNILELTG